MEKIKLIEKDELVPIYNPDDIDELRTFEVAVLYNPVEFNTELLGCIMRAGKINFAFKLSSNDEDDNKPTVFSDLIDTHRRFTDVSELIMTSRSESAGAARKSWSELYNITTHYNGSRSGCDTAPILYEVSNKTVLLLAPVSGSPLDFGDQNTTSLGRYEPKIITTDVSLITTIVNSRDSSFHRVHRNVFDNYALFGENLSLRCGPIQDNNGILNKDVIDYLNYMFFLNHMVR